MQSLIKKLDYKNFEINNRVRAIKFRWDYNFLRSFLKLVFGKIIKNLKLFKVVIIYNRM